MHNVISPIVTTAFGSSRRLTGGYCASHYCTGEYVPEGWWNRGMEQAAALHYGPCRVARRVYVTDCGDTSTRDCWTSQRAKVGRSE